MLAKDKKRAEAMAYILGEDVAEAMGVPKLSKEWADFVEAVSLFVFATGKMEHVACTGALVYTAAQVDRG